MFFWRLTSVIFLIIGLFLFVQSLLAQNITFFYFAFASYGVASLIWLAIDKLYTDFSMPKSTQLNSTNNTGWLYDDVFSILEIVLNLPKIIFLFLIHAIYN